MNKSSVIAIVALITAMLACQTIIPTESPKPQSSTPQSPSGNSDLGCQETIVGVKELQSNLKLPPHFSEENPSKQGGEFDPNRYFEVFTHLQMQDGYVLDYVYHQDGFGGFPLFYARPVDQEPYANEAEYEAAAQDSYDYKSFVVPQDSAEGYFEYAAFTVLASQFYLYWHANYNDMQVLCGKDDIESIIQALSDEDSFGMPMTSYQKIQARGIKKPEPSVTMTDEIATVKMLTFTQWGGFYLQEFTIDRSDHSILDVEKTLLVEYQCGIMF